MSFTLQIFSFSPRLQSLVSALATATLLLFLGAASQDSHGAQLNFAALPSYDYAGQDSTGSVDILDGGNTVRLRGNRWRAFRFPYVVTPDTRLSFTFSSDVRGEIHGIGLDSNLNYSGTQLFQLYGTQWLGLQQYRDYSGGLMSYDIPVGEYFTGSMNYLVLVMDHDVWNPDGESIFSNVNLYEAGAAPLPVPPVVSFAGVSGNVVVPEGQPFPVEILASDTDGSIDSCELYINGDYWNSRADAPYAFNKFVRSLPAGDYTLSALCTDDSGLQASDELAVAIVSTNTPPIVSFALPASDITIAEGTLSPVEIVSSDAEGTVQRCDLYVNGEYWNTRSAAPYAFNKFVRTLPPGSHVLGATCTDEQGLSASAQRRIVVVASDQPPVVDFVSPSTDISISEGQSLAVEIAASDADGSVSRCELYINGSYWNSRSDAPYAFNKFVRSLSVGDYTLEARCTDNSGLSSTAFRDLTINSGQPIQLLGLPQGASLPAGGNLSLEVISTSPTFVISNCRLSANGSFIRQENYAPYQWGNSSGSIDTALNNLANGDYRLRVDCESTGGQSASVEQVIAVGQFSAAAPGSASVQLDWIIPTTREDGSPLAGSEIDSYVIHYYPLGNSGSHTEEIVDAFAGNGSMVSSYELQGLASGSWEFTIATIDSEGRVSRFVAPVRLDIP